MRDCRSTRAVGRFAGCSRKASTAHQEGTLFPLPFPHAHRVHEPKP